MTNEQIRFSLNTGELKLGNWDKLSHYGLVGFLLLTPGFVIIFQLKDYFQETPRPIHDAEIWLLIIPSLLGLLVYRLQKNRLKFKIIDTKLTREEVTPIVEKVANELEWTLYLVDKKVIIAKTHPSFFSGSWGEQITILFDENRILVNSICDPDQRSSIVSMGRNKRNMKKLSEEIKKAAL